MDADRTALFLTDSRTQELYARVFDMGDETEASLAAATHIQKEIRYDAILKTTMPFRVLYMGRKFT